MNDPRERAPYRNVGRRTPAKGVLISLANTNWVFLTVCTQDRERWLAFPHIQRALHNIWENSATAFLVSDYLLMPDHLHLFCAPQDLNVTIEAWITFWKSKLAKAQVDAGKFQVGGFHHRLRDGEEYSEKWIYVQENPVRHGPVENPEEWPYRGRVHDIRF